MEQKRNDQGKPAPSQHSHTNEPKRGKSGGFGTSREPDRPASSQRQQQAGGQSGMPGQQGSTVQGQQGSRVQGEQDSR